MKKQILILLTSLLAVSAQAQQSVGFGRVTDITHLAVVSLDGNWRIGTEGGMIIWNNKTNELVFRWPDTGIVKREALTVSWSPDSQRVIILDQMGKAPLFLAAALENGQWHAVDALSARDPKEPAQSRVTKIELGNWVSPISIQISVKHLVDQPPTPNPVWVQYTTTLTFTDDSLQYALN